VNPATYEVGSLIDETSDLAAELTLSPYSLITEHFPMLETSTAVIYFFIIPQDADVPREVAKMILEQTNELQLQLEQKQQKLLLEQKNELRLQLEQKQQKLLLEQKNERLQLEQKQQKLLLEQKNELRLQFEQERKRLEQKLEQLKTIESYADPKLDIFQLSIRSDDAASGKSKAASKYHEALHCCICGTFAIRGCADYPDVPITWAHIAVSSNNTRAEKAYKEYGVAAGFVDDLNPKSERNFIPLCGTSGSRKPVFDKNGKFTGKMESTCHSLFDNYEMIILYNPFVSNYCYWVGRQDHSLYNIRIANNELNQTGDMANIPKTHSPYKRLLVWRAKYCFMAKSSLFRDLRLENMNIFAQVSQIASVAGNDYALDGEEEEEIFAPLQKKRRRENSSLEDFK
jgi:hypothetical protein